MSTSVQQLPPSASHRQPEPSFLQQIDPRRSLRARMALIIALVTVMLALIMAVVTGQISGKRIQNDLGKSMGQIAATMVQQIDRTMFERWREIRTVAMIPTAFADSNPTTMRTLLTQIKISNRFYAWLGWMDADGVVVAGSEGALEGQNVADRTWFQQALTSDQPFIGKITSAFSLPSVIADPDDPAGAIDVAMAIRDLRGNTIGVIGAQLDWRFMHDQVGGIEQQINNLSNVGADNHIDTELFLLMTDDHVLIGPASPEKITTAILPDFNLPSITAAKSGQPGYSIDRWPDGNTYLTGYAQDRGFRGYPGLGWVVLVRQPADLALASVRQLQWLLVGQGVVFAVLFSAIGWVLVGRITSPLTQIVDRARTIKTGDLHDSDVLPTLVADEVTVLTITINRLLTSLNARNAQLTDINRDLEQTVQARTAELEASNRFSAKITSTIPDMLYVFDLTNQQYVYVNPQSGAVLGDEAALWLTQQGNEQAIHPDDLHIFRTGRERIQAAADGELIEQSFRFRKDADSWGWLNTRETVFARDVQGQVTQVFGVAQDVTLRKRAEDELQHSAATQERQRLARELHDSVTQTLFSASMVAQTLPLLWDRGEVVVKKNLAELTRLTRGALAEMRTMLNELRPAAIATGDLRELLSHLCDAAQGRTQAECQLVIEGNPDLPQEIKVAVYRVAQEALNNITKHARATHVEVALRRDADQVQLRVTDDGRGFVPEQSVADHFGLGIMQERAAEVGASLSIHSVPTQGTTIIFTKSLVAEPQTTTIEVTA